MFLSALTLSLAAFPQGAISEDSRILSSNPGYAFAFGYSVDLDGDTLVASALSDNAFGDASGAIYVYQRDGLDWVEQARLKGWRINKNDRIGMDVAVSGDMVAASSQMTEEVHIFLRTGTDWRQIQKITNPDMGNAVYFGQSLAMDQRTLVVGVPHWVWPGTTGGEVLIYEFDGTVWNFQAKVAATDWAKDSHFGWQVSLAGDTLIVGAPHDTIGGERKGSAYIYQRQDTVWVEQAKLTAADGELGDRFGASVSLSGDRAIIGAYTAKIPGTNDEAGAAYVFERNGATWTQAAKLAPSMLKEGIQFGKNVEIEGDHAVVSAPGFNGDRGLFVHYRNLHGSWRELHYGADSTGEAYDRFGSSLALDHGRLIVGIPNDHVGVDGAGAVCAYSLFRIDLNPEQLTAGQNADVTVSGGAPDTWTYLAMSTTGLGVYPVPSHEVVLELDAPIALRSPVRADAFGTASWSQVVPPAAAGMQIWMQALQVGRTTGLVGASIQ